MSGLLICLSAAVLSSIEARCLEKRGFVLVSLWHGRKGQTAAFRMRHMSLTSTGQPENCVYGGTILDGIVGESYRHLEYKSYGVPFEMCKDSYPCGAAEYQYLAGI